MGLLMIPESATAVIEDKAPLVMGAEPGVHKSYVPQTFDGLTYTIVVSRSRENEPSWRRVDFVSRRREDPSHKEWLRLVQAEIASRQVSSGIAAKDLQERFRKSK